MDLQFTAPTLVELFLVVISSLLALSVFVLFAKLRAMANQLNAVKASAEEKIAHIEITAKDAVNRHDESQARRLVITRHLQSLDEKHVELENQVRDLKLQDPSLRLYQRAADLVKQGASIEEIIEACDIPRAEAEMLMMVHKQNN